MTRFLGGSIKLAMLLAAFAAHAEVKVDTPWLRATVDGQTVSGAFMTLRSSGDATLTAVATPVAGVAEIHEMSLQGGIMKMRPVHGLPLPAGKPVEFKPGGYHIMLMDLKRNLTAGEHVPITLSITGANRKIEKVEVSAEVRALGAAREESHH